ncbi:MAG: CPBP family intramembrane metalloprotease [Candidatus Thorarchaeota archaeon]|nr:CPBP family intramembrane metalloprotease [Candidatus Thorarchaeota archaeon]
MVRDWIQRNAVASYVLLTYGITWSLAIVLALSYHGVISLQIPFALHYILPYGPMLSALIVTWLRGGTQSLHDLLGRMSKWRIRPVWIIIALFSVWVFYIASALMMVAMGQPWPDLSIFGQVMYLPYLTFFGAWALWIFTYGIGEETGWRGYLLPHIQTRYSAFVSSLIVAIIWAGWHAPMFLYNENLMSLGPIGTVFWTIGLMFGSVLLTWIYNNTEGSILMTAIWHGTFNTFSAAAGQAASVPSGIISMLVMVVVVLVVIIYRPKNLSHLERQQATD